MLAVAGTKHRDEKQDPKGDVSHVQSISTAD
jgi:hypothetical protein